MSEEQGYSGKALECLKKNNAKVGDSIKITAGLQTYSGILMPRYESGDDKHLVDKLGNGYNVSIVVSDIQKIQILSSPEAKPKQSEERKEDLVEKMRIRAGVPSPKIKILWTGGTITSSVDYKTGGVTPKENSYDIYEEAPELKNLFDGDGEYLAGLKPNIDTEVLFTEFSENLQPDHWIKIAEKLDSLVDSDYKGIIIAHGTDTMHYTSAFLSFALAGFPIPVALVGSQRSPDRASSDAIPNLIAATKFLVNCWSPKWVPENPEHENLGAIRYAEEPTRGIFVVMHQQEEDQTIACHIGTRVRKNHTSKRTAFETVGGHPAFTFFEGKITKNMQDDFFKDAKYNPRIKINTKVALVKYHPGYDPKLIENLIQTGCKAIIFEGTGLGHVGRTMHDVIKNAKENDLFLGMTSQCIDGRVSMTVYESGRDLLGLGITPLENMTPETSLVKAMWALGNSKDVDEMNELMLEKIASEF